MLKGEGLTTAIRRQFADEADTMAQLADHPYIVQVFRAETSARRPPLPGHEVLPAAEHGDAGPRASGSRVEEVLRTGIQLASAVETAHRAGITHRDIKPANVLVSQYGAPGLTDFGIAGQLGPPREEDDDDDVGVSVPWAPPEVLFGQSNGDARADVYSPGRDAVAAARRPVAVRGPRWRQLGIRPDAPDPLQPGAEHRSGRRAGLARAAARPVDGQGPGNRPATALAFARALQEIEQEQRFPRTAIVVLDEQGQTTLADQTPTRPSAEEDRTRVRSPQAVRSAQACRSRGRRTGIPAAARRHRSRRRGNQAPPRRVGRGRRSPTTSPRRARSGSTARATPAGTRARPRRPARDPRHRPEAEADAAGTRSARRCC